MKTKEEFKEQLKPYLEIYPDEQAFFITDDGTVFLSGNRNDGQNHANNIKSELHVFTREDFEATTVDEDNDGIPDKGSTVNDIKAWLTEKEVVFTATKKDDLLALCFEKIAEEKEAAEAAAKSENITPEQPIV